MKNHNCKQRFVVPLLGLAMLSLSSGLAAAEEAIKIGGIVSLTGGSAAIGKAAQEAWKMAIDDINASGGVLGEKVTLALADTMTDPAHAASEV